MGQCDTRWLAATLTGHDRRASRSSPTSTATCPRSRPRSRGSTSSGIERVYCGGDLVGYGPHPNEVCALIERARRSRRSTATTTTRSAATSTTAAARTSTEHDRELGQQSVEWTLDAHRPGSQGLHARAAVRPALSRSATRQVHLVHGSPRKVNEYLFEDKPARLYERLAAAEDADVLVFGHTHKPWVHDFGGVRFVNCGSVGKPKDGDPRGAFAVLELDAAGQVRRHGSSASPTTSRRSRARCGRPAYRRSTPTSSWPRRDARCDPAAAGRVSR